MFVWCWSSASCRASVSPYAGGVLLRTHSPSVKCYFGLYSAFLVRASFPGGRGTQTVKLGEGNGWFCSWQSCGVVATPQTGHFDQTHSNLAWFVCLPHNTLARKKHVSFFEPKIWFFFAHSALPTRGCSHQRWSITTSPWGSVVDNTRLSKPPTSLTGRSWPRTILTNRYSCSWTQIHRKDLSFPVCSVIRRSIRYLFFFPSCVV